MSSPSVCLCLYSCVSSCASFPLLVFYSIMKHNGWAQPSMSPLPPSCSLAPSPLFPLSRCGYSCQLCSLCSHFLVIFCVFRSASPSVLCCILPHSCVTLPVFPCEFRFLCYPSLVYFYLYHLHACNKAVYSEYTFWSPRL